MASINKFESFDFTLLRQYYDILGKEGVAQSLVTFNRLIPEYIQELQSLICEDETLFRRQAHKIKGSCRSLGFLRLGKLMEFLERETWTWDEAKTKVEQFAEFVQPDQQAVETWLNDL